VTSRLLWLPFLLLPLVPAGCKPSAAQKGALAAVPVRFTDVTSEAGIDFVHSHGGFGKKYFVETSGSGACFFDYDKDGKPDLYVVQSGTLPGRPGFGTRNRSVLYRNVGEGRFEDVTARAGVANNAYGQGACAGDYDSDGDLDLYVTNFGANHLYRNNGDGTFTDVTAKAGVAVPGYNTSAAFSDIDVDGDLDLYVARYAHYRIGQDPPCSQAAGLHSYCPPSQFDGDVDALLRNNGDGTFTDITAASGTRDPEGKGLGVVFFDHNDDGLPDLYVANDGTMNQLYENLGNCRFKELTMLAGVGLYEHGVMAAGMGVDAGDYDGDGRFDLFVANFTAEPNDLYRNRGDGIFELESTASGLGEPALPFTGFGAAFFDYDLDGLQDVIVANGHVADDIAKATPGITYGQPESLYRNLGNGQFADVSKEVGPDFVRETVSRGLALADIDADGDLDVFINNCNGKPQLLRNDGGNQRRWIQLRLKAAKGDPFALGARVEVEAGGRKQVREVRSGTSYCSQHDLLLTVGLGTAERADRVTVRWPGRASQEWRALGAGEVHLLSEAARQATGLPVPRAGAHGSTAGSGDGSR
jgi:hypothetical protein